MCVCFEMRVVHKNPLYGRVGEEFSYVLQLIVLVFLTAGRWWFGLNVA